MARRGRVWGAGLVGMDTDAAGQTWGTEAFSVVIGLEDTMLLLATHCVRLSHVGMSQAVTHTTPHLDYSSKGGSDKSIIAPGIRCRLNYKLKSIHHT